MKNLGILWDFEVEWDDDEPFQTKNLDRDYEVYSELAREKGLQIFVAKFSWYNDGKLEKAWKWDGDKWVKVRDIELDGVYDKYRFDSETKKLKLKISEELPVINDPELERICKDKLETYELFPDYVPETMVATQENAEKMLETYDMIVFKPRYGASGDGVEFIEEIDNFKEPENSEEYIIQQFISTEGFEPGGVKGPHDLRTHVINGEIQEGNYVRQPREGLKSNISTGGKQVYIENSQIPENAMNILEKVAERFSNFHPSIFSVDFMFSGDDVWLVELNSKPAMYYHYPEKEKKYELPRMKKLVEAWAELLE